MNSPVNRLSESPPSTDRRSSDSSMVHQVPIPSPSHPRQYRAIGLVKGQYMRSQDKITRGVLVTTEGTVIDAVLLGRMLSVVKNHLDLDQPHLWVVYPRTRPKNDQLHLQIMGVWEPETLSQAHGVASLDQSISSSALPMENGYFSIRGEAIFASQEKQTVIIKIRQSPKKQPNKPKFFKVKLKGTLPDRPIGHFWDLQVKLQQDILLIETATDLGFIPKKKPFSKFNKQNSQRPLQRREKRPLDPGDRPDFPKQSLDRPKPAPRRKPLPKPIKGNRRKDT